MIFTGYDDFCRYFFFSFSSVFFPTIYSGFSLVYKCKAISLWMPDKTVAVRVGRCKRDGILVAGHPIITAHFPFLVFSQLFNPSHFTIMDRVQAFGKTFR